ncbi:MULTISPECIES: ABC transporter ATP-binding protein [unclassified Methanoculleus]|uniref:ABC transporter ATP-binding protein n=2 Tax=Methanoculleus TaxID=45989 RepID=A0ABD8A8F9_9EURY|nr:ABC transporter ATP-binding protein [Methanoculleus palmolei]
MKLEAKHLSFRYRADPVLNDVCIIAEPMVTAVIGPNAAGKSTLLRCLCGILKPEGSILLDGKDLKAYGNDDLLQAVSYLPQDSSSNAALTVFEAVLLGRLNSLSWTVTDEDLSLTLDALENLGIEELAKVPLNELSGGQKQMVSIAQSIAKKPAVLLMDEPTNSLDLQHQLELFDLIRTITKRHEHDDGRRPARPQPGCEIRGQDRAAELRDG